MNPLHKAIVSRICGELIRPSLKDNLPIVRAMMGSCHERMQTVRGVLVEIDSRKLADAASDCGLLPVLDGVNNNFKLTHLER
ncbi:hypothetical protein K9838_06200 [Xanthomonas phaseoli pv. manihotis]|uniref:hypothetical protein n=1 Tax=Xanthomonas phaseoli TaxID=1985254 RepID=UPI00037EB458|nr:hypothetical protein [Xanthomonas phaseoli]UEQ16231.1 hypothetical protein K9838_06200 [Xanthomonas phaseoli pv. manihotis]